MRRTSRSTSALLKAASVHILTASGAACGLLAINAVISGDHEQAFGWLGLAFFIDGIDGYFARLYDVKSVLPHVSGEILDLCVDYVTYVFVPALMLLHAGKIAGPLGLALAAIICITALYHFSDTGAKADDNSFVGFPAIWNIVAFYVFALGLPGWATVGLIMLCCGLTFVPLKWVHPMRVVVLRGPTLALTAAWAAAAISCTLRGFPANWIETVILIAVAIYGVSLSLYLGRAR